ncbi:MAG: Acyltransferase 3 [Chthoniobacteraceae bacterium]|nr:Acyltransferase 3 [Chthoniobacteraceae bacterium]
MERVERNNSFTFLRLIFALSVVVAHSFALGRFGLDPLQRASHRQTDLGSLGVICFFIVSGYLITASALRLPIRRFALNRCARILPGFFAVQLLTVFVLVPAVIQWAYPGVAGYWDCFVLEPDSAISYLTRNAFLFVEQYKISFVFTRNPGNVAVNGSLWSLGPEAFCYLCLALLALCHGLRHRFVSVLVFVAVYAVHVFATANPAAFMKLLLPLGEGQVQMLNNPNVRSAFLGFAAGMLFFQFRERVKWNGWLFGGALLGLCGALFLKGFSYTWPFFLPYIVFALAFNLPFKRMERWGDFSYGIYIYAFPIQQCLAMPGVFPQGLPALGVGLFTTFSIVLSCLAGVASWYLIEAPVLRWARSIERPTVPKLDGATEALVS